MTIEQLFNEAQVIAFLCNQYGDTGKGKFANAAAQWADVNARGTGGDNAGHTFYLEDGREVILHVVPVGIEYDSIGKTSVLGQGMVINPKSLVAELDILDQLKLSYNNLMISQDAHVITPFHVALDKAKNQSLENGGIGSTGKGIGPCYEDKIGRRGIRIGDLLNVDVLAKKVKKLADERYSSLGLNVDEVIAELSQHNTRLKPFVMDTTTEMQSFHRRGMKISLEGAQGLLLSSEFGTYPYNTSSDCSLNGTASGVGLSAKAVDKSFGLVKFPVMSRVGGGPFTTEICGKVGEAYCKEKGRNIISELKESDFLFDEKTGKCDYNLPQNKYKMEEMLHSPDQLTVAAGLRLQAGEFGATTGRLRRLGWIDAVAGRYAVNVNGPLMILTKADAFAGLAYIKMATSYVTKYAEDNSPVYTQEFNRDLEFLNKAKPSYRTYEGYESLKGINNREDLPEGLSTAIKDFEEITRGRVVAVSVGPKKDETLF